MVLHVLLCKHFDILIILFCLDVCPKQLLSPKRGSKCDVGFHIYKQLLKIFLRTAKFNMRRGSMINKNIKGKQI